MGQPLEQGLRTCLVSLELAEAAGVGKDVLPEIYYTALLRFLGCTADAHEAAAIAGNDIALRAAIAPVLGAAPVEFLRGVLPSLGSGMSLPRRASLTAGFLASGAQRMREGVRADCEAAEMLALRLGLPAGTRAALASAFEQWGGRGFPNGLAGEAIPLAARAVTVARDVEVITRLGGPDAARSALRERAGRAYDPALAAAARRHFDQLLSAARTEAPWNVALDHEPQPAAVVPAQRLDEVLAVFADFADLKEPDRAGFSRDVAELAAAASPAHADLLRRTGLVQDLGRVAIPSRPAGAAASPADDERLRLHPYYSERILARVPTTAPLARHAGAHHERLDGSGYYRGASAADLPWESRVLAAAVAFRELLLEPAGGVGPEPASAADALASLAPRRLDPEAVDAVLAAAGLRAHRIRAAWPAGLTDREVDVLRLICRGASKKEVAAALVISARTVDHHVRHIYGKLGVSSRAAATLFAVEHDLL
jgi:HD-GYP domain-containing protein (c-di-GMP phosphodiesterase class II)/DNA-binding CsgD family transcriptional regulator